MLVKWVRVESLLGEEESLVGRICEKCASSREWRKRREVTVVNRRRNCNVSCCADWDVSREPAANVRRMLLADRWRRPGRLTVDGRCWSSASRRQSAGRRPGPWRCTARRRRWSLDSRPGNSSRRRPIRRRRQKYQSIYRVKWRHRVDGHDTIDILWV